MAVDSDYYSILGVSRHASDNEIRRAFRERVRACHPDRVANLDEDLRRLAEEKMVQLNEAYAVLRNPARRAAYDNGSIATAERARRDRSEPGGFSAATAAPPAAEQQPGTARNRIGEHRFVARAAGEEFEQQVKQCFSRHATWTRVDIESVTLALQACEGRHNFYFVLFAEPRLDQKGLRRFLQLLEASAAGLRPRWWGRSWVLGFVAAVEFAGTERMRKLVDLFNATGSRANPISQITLIDLVNWRVVPGETTLGSRLRFLIRGE